MVIKVLHVIYYYSISKFCIPFYLFFYFCAEMNYLFYVSLIDFIKLLTSPCPSIVLSNCAIIISPWLHLTALVIGFYPILTFYEKCRLTCTFTHSCRLCLQFMIRIANIIKVVHYTITQSSLATTGSVLHQYLSSLIRDVL